MAINSIILQDILDQLNDYLQNFTTGTIDLGNRIRAVNRAFEYVKRRLTLPGDEVIQKFYFTQDNNYYNLNVDFNEGLQVIYDNYVNNISDNEWEYKPYPDILRVVGDQSFGNWWSWTVINGVMQLLMFGTNQFQGSTLATFDAITGFIGQNNAQNLNIDTNIFKEGSGSLSFDINPALGNTGTASIYWTVNYDFRTLHQQNGILKLYVWLPVTTISSINLVVGSSPTDYYTFVATTYDDATAFVVNQWKRVQFRFVDNPTVVGSPNDQAINFIRVDFVQGGSFGNAVVQNFRIDDLYTQFPDYMDLIYLSAYKGTDTTGKTKKIFLDTNTDIPTFNTFMPDLIDVIALRAAKICAPQIMKNLQFASLYKQDCEEIMRVMGRSFPRKRVVNMGKLLLKRSG